MPIEINKRNGKAIIRATASETVTLANLQVGSEVVTAAAINSVYWTVANGTITVARGANTVFVLTEGQDNWILDGDFGVIKDSTANVAITFSAGAAGTILLEVNKKSDGE